MIKISASIMCADLCHLEDDISVLEKAGIDRLHFDIGVLWRLLHFRGGSNLQVFS